MSQPSRTGSPAAISGNGVPDRAGEAQSGPPAGASEGAAADAATRLQAFTTVVQIVTALLLIVLFILFLVVLYFERDDKNWDRLVFLLAGLEAIVFAGAGALFGTTVQRGTVQAAQQDAATAKADAAHARTRADEAQSAADAGRALYHVVREKAATARTASAQPVPGQGGRPREGHTQPTDPHLAELDAIAQALFRGH